MFFYSIFLSLFLFNCSSFTAEHQLLVETTLYTAFSNLALKTDLHIKSSTMTEEDYQMKQQ